MRGNGVKVKDGIDVNSIMRDMMFIILEGILNQEMGEELGYSRYNYRNEDIGNSRNGYSKKTMHTSYGAWYPKRAKRWVWASDCKKYQNTGAQDMEERIISMYIKGMTISDMENIWENYIILKFLIVQSAEL